MTIWNYIVRIICYILCRCHVLYGDCGETVMEVITDNNCTNLALVPHYHTSVGSKITYKCSSLLISMSLGSFAYCPVQTCLSDSTWSRPSISCAQSECYSKGDSSSYRGRRSCSLSGIPCQKWSSQVPHAHAYTSGSYFWRKSIVDYDTSFCRDPKGVKGSPWCYTIDPSIEWEFCDVPKCSELAVDDGICINDIYEMPSECDIPTLHVTSDSVCTELADIEVLSLDVGSVIVYKCNSFMTSYTSRMDYCPVDVCKPDGEWSKAQISCAYNECYNVGKSALYVGRRNCSVTGKPCQKWAELVNTEQASSFMSAASLFGAYCRDPGGKRGAPWCFTSVQSNKWEFCGIQICSESGSAKSRCNRDNLINEDQTTSIGLSSITISNIRHMNRTLIAITSGVSDLPFSTVALPEEEVAIHDSFTPSNSINPSAHVLSSSMSFRGVVFPNTDVSNDGKMTATFESPVSSSTSGFYPKITLNLGEQCKQCATIKTSEKQYMAIDIKSERNLHSITPPLRPTMASSPDYSNPTTHSTSFDVGRNGRGFDDHTSTSSGPTPSPLTSFYDLQRETLSSDFSVTHKYSHSMTNEIIVENGDPPGPITSDLKDKVTHFHSIKTYLFLRGGILQHNVSNPYDTTVEDEDENWMISSVDVTDSEFSTLECARECGKVPGCNFYYVNKTKCKMFPLIPPVPLSVCIDNMSCYSRL